MASEEKWELPILLRWLVGAKLTVPEAMDSAAKLLPAGYTSEAKLLAASDKDLSSIITDVKRRKAIVNAIKKAVKSYGGGGNAVPSKTTSKRKNPSVNDNATVVASGDKGGAGPPAEDKSMVTKKVKTNNQPPQADTVETIPLTASEEDIKATSVLINRAPVMCLWATVVLQKLGYTFEESMSIAKSYTELNAIAKGQSIGLFEKKESGSGHSGEGGMGGEYVNIMNRKIHVISVLVKDTDGNETESGGHYELRAVSKAKYGGTVGAPRIIEPKAVLAYLKRSFKENLSASYSALRFLAESHDDADDLHSRAFYFYEEFRPSIPTGKAGWGAGGRLDLSKVLNLRPQRDVMPDGLERSRGGSGASLVDRKEDKYEVDDVGRMVNVKPDMP